NSRSAGATELDRGRALRPVPAQDVQFHSSPATEQRLGPHANRQLDNRAAPRSIRRSARGPLAPPSLKHAVFHSRKSAPLELKDKTRLTDDQQLDLVSLSPSHREYPCNKSLDHHDLT